MSEAFSPQRWLEAIPARQSDLRTFAEHLAGYADSEGLVTASSGFLRHACGVRSGAADKALKQLREGGLIEVHRRGDVATKLPTIWRLTYAASPVYTTTTKEN